MRKRHSIPLKIVGKARMEALLDEAAIELNSRGVSQASLSAIASRLGVTRAALYYYIKNQEDLVFECYQRACKVIARRISRAKEGSGDALGVLHSFVEGMLDPEEPEIAALWELGFLTGAKRETVDGLLGGVVAQLARILEDGIAENSIRSCNTTHVAWTILGIVSWPSLLRRTNPEFENVFGRSLAPKINDLLTNGVAGDRSHQPEIERKQLPIGVLQVSDIFAPEHVAEAKRESLLASGSRLLNQKGVDATSLDGIASSLGVSKAVIYHNIGDKPTFVLECFRRSYRMFIGMSEAMEAAPGPRLAAAASVIHLTCRSYLDPSGPLVIPMVGFESLPEETARELRDLAQQLADIWRRTLELGIAEKSFRKLDVDLVVAVTSAYIQWNTKWNLAANMPVADGLATEIVNLWCFGLAPLKAKSEKPYR